VMTGSTSNWAFVQNDAGSFIGNSLYGGKIYDLQTDTSSPIANALTPAGAGIGATIVKGVPYGWTLTVDSASATAMSRGILGFGYGVEKNPFGDGMDDFVFQFQGYAGATGGNITLTHGVQSPLSATFTEGSSQRAICRIKISAGPNGHLYGLTGLSVLLYDQNAGTFTPPGLSTGGYYMWRAITGGGGATFNDASIWTGAPNVSSTALGNVLTLDELTPAAQVRGGGSNASQVILTANFTAGDPVSATVRLQSCRAMQVSQ
jgi:hypothetical protein